MFRKIPFLQKPSFHFYSCFLLNIKFFSFQIKISTQKHYNLLLHRSSYYSYWAEIDTLLQTFATRREDQNESLETTRYHKNINDSKPFKLSLIELPTFSGEYKDWRNFYKLLIP